MSRRNRNDYDWDYPHRPGSPHDGYPPLDNLTDEMQWAGLGPAQGDEMPDRRIFNHPWGKTTLLSAVGIPSKGIPAQLTDQLVQTEAYPRPFPWAIQARFSLDGVTYTPRVPATWGGTVTFKFRKSFDLKTGQATETAVLIADQALPLCSIIARALAVSVTIEGESVLDLYVQFVVCPTQQIDCTELVGEGTAGPSEAEITTFIPTEDSIGAPGVLVLGRNANRKMLIFENNAETACYIALSNNDLGAAPPGSEVPRWSILLPPGISAQYGMTGSGDTWKGKVFVAFDDVDGDPPSGQLMITEGT
jgi:hypothetical protein